MIGLGFIQMLMGCSKASENRVQWYSRFGAEGSAVSGQPPGDEGDQQLHTPSPDAYKN